MLYSHPFQLMLLKLIRIHLNSSANLLNIMFISMHLLPQMMSYLISFVWVKSSRDEIKGSKTYNIVAAFRGMHVSPAKHSYV